MDRDVVGRELGHRNLAAVPYDTGVATIDVLRVSGVDSMDAFRVRVSEGRTSTEHTVSITGPPPAVAARYGSLEEFVTASFRFLLAREPKESILSSFEIREIGRYFPEWENELDLPF
jgi:hypothetical protein